MELKVILYPVLCLGSLGFIFGAGLAYASQKFAIEVDPKLEAIREALPGVNCGACGYPGCDGFAKGVLAGEAPVTGCPVGRAKTAEALSQIMEIQ